MGEEGAVGLIARRVRGAAWIALIGLVIFAVTDLHRAGGVAVWLAPLKGVQVMVAGATILVLGRVRTPRAVTATAVLFLSGLVLTASTAATVRGESVSVPILASLAAVLGAAMMPWGRRAQAVMAAVCGLAALLNAWAVDGIAKAFPYPALPTIVALVASVFTAHDLERQRRERLRLERARSESELRFRTLADDAPALIWMSEVDGRVSWANQAWRSLLGTPDAERDLGAVWRAAIDPEDRARVRATIAAAMTRREPFEVEYRLRDTHGEDHWLLMRGRPRIVDERCVGYIGSGTDVTVLKQAAVALDEARHAAVETSRLKSEFLANLSHEIRTPMNGIFGMTEMALGADGEGERRECLQRARACAESLMTLLNDILDFSKIDAGKLELERLEFSPREVVERVLDTLAIDAQRKRIELLGWIDPSVPDRVLGDPGRLRQVLLNLGSNAVKFTAQGEVEVTLARRASASDDVVLWGEVRDTGIGIPPEKRAAIFDAFTQVDGSMSRRYGGSGLGLTIAQRLVTMMGGEIECESAVGLGSRFRFTVHLGAAPTRTASQPHLPPGARLLVVDGNVTSRHLLATAVEAFGGTAIAVASAREAIELVRDARRGDEPFDAVLLDLHLPEAGASVFARWLQAEGRSPQTAVVLLSALGAGRGDLPPGLHLDAVLTKPVKQAELLAALVQLVADRERFRSSPARSSA